MPRPDFPRTILDFQRRFPDDQACMEYLFASRWPEGFCCPRCGYGQAWPVARRRLVWECASCHRQTSVTAGTVLHKTHTPLHLWFWAAYLMATATPGISALQLQRQLGLGRYETAWMLLHKLRRAMVNPERTQLRSPVEVDECLLSGHSELRGGRRHGAHALVIVAAEVRGSGTGRVRLQVIDNASADILCGFVTATVEPGATVHTDAWQGYKRLTRLGYDHQPRSQRAQRLLGQNPEEILPGVHRLISHLKTWLQGTHRGVSEEHLQTYLEEFTFRFNRRRTPMAAFQTLLGLGSGQSPTTYRQITTTKPT
jgi:transposase-like protein